MTSEFQLGECTHEQHFGAIYFEDSKTSGGSAVGTPRAELKLWLRLLGGDHTKCWIQNVSTNIFRVTDFVEGPGAPWDLDYIIGFIGTSSPLELTH